SARKHLEDALARIRKLGDKRDTAAALVALAQLHRAEGDLGAAEPLYEDALKLAREVGDHETIAVVLLNLTMTWIGRGVLERAAAPRHMTRRSTRRAPGSRSWLTVDDLRVDPTGVTRVCLDRYLVMEFPLVVRVRIIIPNLINTLLLAVVAREDRSLSLFERDPVVREISGPHVPCNEHPS